MRRRAAHLACLLLLLSSLGATETAATRGDLTLGGHYIGVLLQEAAAIRAESPLHRRLDAIAEVAPAALPATDSVAWIMRPPAAHSVAVHAVTGSGL